MGEGQAVRHVTGCTYTDTPTSKTQMHKAKRASGFTFNLPADLSEVSHPLEDFWVSCLVSMRGLQKEEEKKKESKALNDMSTNDGQ